MRRDPTERVLDQEEAYDPHFNPRPQGITEDEEKFHKPNGTKDDDFTPASGDGK